MKRSISKDLGIFGDDAEEILNEYFKIFSIDITNFNFSDYFGEESFDLFAFFKRIVTNKKYKDLTIGNLVEIAKKGSGILNEVECS